MATTLLDMQQAWRDYVQNDDGRHGDQHWRSIGAVGFQPRRKGEVRFECYQWNSDNRHPGLMTSGCT